MSSRSRFDIPKTRIDGRIVYVLAALALILIGVGVSTALILTKPELADDPKQHQERLVRVFRAEKGSHLAAVTAYGTTRAAERWTAIAEVRGRAVQVNPRFEPGELLPADALLVRIDPTDYQLAVNRFEAEAKAREKQVDELEQTEANLKTLLKLQERQVRLAEAEYQRVGRSYASKAVSRSALEAAENAYVSSLTAMQQTRNSLALVPAQRDLAVAQLNAATAQSNQARQDLSKCDIRLPFAARCATKSIEVNQYVAAGEQLGAFLTIDVAEVVAMVDTRKMPNLFPGGIDELDTADFIRLSSDRSFWKRFRIPVEVRWGPDNLRSMWYGRVARIAGGLDPGTRTVPVIVEVPKPYENVRPGIRPPLLPDAFCEVTAYGKTLHDVVVIPRDALRDNRVYLLRKGKLHIQPVTVVSLEKQLAAISEGIEEGDMVVLTDLFPASEGMPLRGRLVDNPVKPRQQIRYPAELFEAEAEPAAGRREDAAGSGEAQPAPEPPPATQPAAEATS